MLLKQKSHRLPPCQPACFFHKHNEVYYIIMFTYVQQLLNQWSATLSIAMVGNEYQRAINVWWWTCSIYRGNGQLFDGYLRISPPQKEVITAEVLANILSRYLNTSQQCYCFSKLAQYVFNDANSQHPCMTKTFGMQWKRQIWIFCSICQTC